MVVDNLELQRLHGSLHLVDHSGIHRGEPVDVHGR
jgi:hypothetical protein